MAKRKTAPKEGKPAAESGAEAEAKENVFIGQTVGPDSSAEFIYLRLANRHGLITGATGTGKTVTLQGLAEEFSAKGVPVFCADVKGDLAGLAEEGAPKGWITARDQEIGRNRDFQAYPVIFWDLFGEKGLPIRTTLHEMGPLLLSRLMDLSEAQEGVLNIAFKIAADEKLPELVTLQNLQTLLEGLAARADTLTTKYGNITKASVGSIQRSRLVLEQQGGGYFFGEPVLDIDDLMLKDGKRGYISVLAAERLMESPRLYATFLLFLLSELFEKMPEVGDPDKPKLVFFFDEAHLLFHDAPKALLQKVEQVVRLIRSKGVGVYFVTQNPLDVPDTVSRQLGNRIQHALRAFTPMEQKAVKAAATTFRANPAFDTEKAIMELGIGEALVSTLDAKGQPTMVERTLVRPPNSRVGTISNTERETVIEASPVKYPAKPRDNTAEQRRLEEWANELAEPKSTKTSAERSGERKSASASRSDGFWTTLGKSMVRSGVPMLTRLLENVLRSLLTRRGGGGGFTGLGALDTKGGKSPAKSNVRASAAAEAEYVPFKSIPDEPKTDERGLMGTPKRR